MLNRESLEGEISRKFPTFSELLNTINSNKLCDMATYSEYVIENCNEAYNNILYFGFQNYLNEATLVMDILYNKYLSALSKDDKDYLDSMLDLSDCIDTLDLTVGYLARISTAFYDVITDYGLDYISQARYFDIIDLILFIILTIGIFLISLRIFLNDFKISIWKAKRMLGLMPTKFIIRNIDKVKAAMKEVS